MKSKDELQSIIDQIVAPNSPVGMDAVYVHALILDHLQSIHARIDQVEKELKELQANVK